jgi:hypothetical protein
MNTIWCAYRASAGPRMHNKSAPHAEAAGLIVGHKHRLITGRYHLRALRAFLRPFAFDDGVAPAIRKSSCFFPALIAAANHFGFNPRPAQVSAGFSGLRYLGATTPPDIAPVAARSTQISSLTLDFDSLPPLENVPDDLHPQVHGVANIR